MEETVLISVIVPAYNVAPWLSQCLDSILNQHHRRLEVLVIDDGSTDETFQLAQAYAAKDPRVTVLHQPNLGLAAARDAGISRAKGAYIGFVDGDDTISPDMYARLLRNALQYGADISHCGIRFCFPDGRQESHYGTGALLVQDRFSGLQALLRGTDMEPSLCNKLYRAPLLPESCLDPAIFTNEDLLRNFVLFSRAQVSVYEDFCGYEYRQRGTTPTDWDKLRRSYADILAARRLILDRAGPDIYPHALRCWLSAHLNCIQQTLNTQDPALKALSQSCRKTLKTERKNIRCLIPRQRLAAYLILYTPALHRTVYSLYKR